MINKIRDRLLAISMIDIFFVLHFIVKAKIFKEITRDKQNSDQHFSSFF